MFWPQVLHQLLLNCQSEGLTVWVRVRDGHLALQPHNNLMVPVLNTFEETSKGRETEKGRDSSPEEPIAQCFGCSSGLQKTYVLVCWWLRSPLFPTLSLIFCRKFPKPSSSFRLEQKITWIPKNILRNEPLLLSTLASLQLHNSGYTEVIKH